MKEKLVLLIAILLLAAWLSTYSSVITVLEPVEQVLARHQKQKPEK